MAVNLGVAPDLPAARAALARGDWATAREGFTAALEHGETAVAWEGLSWAAWWLDDEELTFSARERAYRAYRADGDPRSAARLAVWLASDAMDFRGDDAVAGGWLQRARHLLAGEAPSAEHGWVSVMEATHALKWLGAPDAAAAHAATAVDLGRRLGITDLEAVGLGLEGMALIALGRAEEGLQRLDAASAVASGEDFELPVSPFWTLCMVVSACEGMGDFTRAAQWCVAMRSLSERWGGRSLLGFCRTAYGNVLAARGDWPAAEAELEAAVGDLQAARPALAAAGLVRLGELRARQGRLEEARSLFERARPHPLALVGLGALALDAGDAAAAADAAERVLRRDGSGRHLDRVPALRLLVRARAALGELDAAATAHAELERAATDLGTPYLRGHADLAAGELNAARGDLEAARHACEDAADGFAACAAPYDAALARVALARVLARLGRERTAQDEARAAIAVLTALGAQRDVELARAATAGCDDVAAAAGGDAAGERRAPAEASELTPRELDVLRLVAQGLSDAEIAERLIVSPHTVHRHVANVRTKLCLPSRAAAVGYAARSGLL